MSKQQREVNKRLLRFEKLVARMELLAKRKGGTVISPSSSQHNSKLKAHVCSNVYIPWYKRRALTPNLWRNE